MYFLRKLRNMTLTKKTKLSHSALVHSLNLRQPLLMCKGYRTLATVGIAKDEKDENDEKDEKNLIC